MSMEALNALPATLPALKAGLATLPASERPSYDVTALVSMHLANRHRTHRGYVNESVDQIAGDLCLADRKVRRALKALDALGLWVADGRGNQHHPTKRRPSFLEGAASGQADDALPDGADSAASGQADGAESEQRPVAVEQRPVAASAPSVTGMSSVRLADDTPNRPPDVTPTSPPRELAHVTNAAEFADALAAMLSEHLPYPVTATNDDRFVADKLLAAITSTADPAAALNAVPRVIRWAATDTFWPQHVTTIAQLCKHWPKLAAAHAAAERAAAPRPTANQQAGINQAQRLLAQRRAREAS